MFVSNAFDELTELLRFVEHNDIDVQNISVQEQNVARTEEITADLSIAVPVLSGFDFCDGVEIRHEGTDLTEEKMVMDVTVTVPTDCDEIGLLTENTSEPQPATDDLVRGDTQDTPLYKDPDALQTVYEEYDTFTEMTDALGVDVTSETVRRYMVEFDIHDPHDDPSSDLDATTDDVETHSPGGQSAGSNEHSTVANASPTSGDQNSFSESAPPHRDETAEDETESDLASVPVVDAIRAAGKEEEEPSLAADGLGIARSLTLADFVDVLESSRTPQEVKKELGMNYDDCRRLLEELNLLDFVRCRISASQANVSPRVICRRLDVDPDEL